MSLHHLQDVFDKTARDGFSASALTKRVLQHVLHERGFEFTIDELDDLAARVSNLDVQVITFRLASCDEEIVLDVAELIAASDAALEGIDGEVASSIAQTMEASTDVCSQSVFKRGTRQVRLSRRHNRCFQRRLRRKWKRGLDDLWLLYLLAIELGQHSCLGGDSPRQFRHGNKASALHALHAKACRTTAEIIHLLEGGFADGAHSRWRGLHELAVVALFISNGDEDLAERYLAHSEIQQYKGATEYQEQCTALGFEPLEAGDIAELARRRDMLIKKYGRDFRKDYGWAANHLGDSGPNFRKIEAKAGLAMWRPLYMQASQGIHAGSHGLKKQAIMAIPSNAEGSFLVGRSNIGLCDPGHSAAISLSQVTCALLSLEPNLDTAVWNSVIKRLIDRIGEELLKSHQKTADCATNLRNHRPCA